MRNTLSEIGKGYRRVAGIMLKSIEELLPELGVYNAGYFGKTSHLYAFKKSAKDNQSPLVLIFIAHPSLKCVDVRSVKLHEEDMVETTTAGAPAFCESSYKGNARVARIHLQNTRKLKESLRKAIIEVTTW